MLKKIVSLLLLTAMLLGCLSAAQAESAPGFAVPEGGYDGSEVTITFYHTMGSNLTAVLDTYIAEFNKLYPISTSSTRPWATMTTCATR